jgi:spermidine synthase
MKLDLRLLRVTALAALVLLVETLFFHASTFLFDAFRAVAVIGDAALGIGLGALAAWRWREVDEDRLFFATTVGSSAAILATGALLVREPSPWWIAVGMSAAFAFPVLYIATAFRRPDAGRVYLYDMAGAGLGVIATVALYALLSTESIVLLLVGALPLAGLWAVRRSPAAAVGPLASAAAIVLALAGGGAFATHLATDAFNVVRITDRADPAHTTRNIFTSLDADRLVRTYDSLVGRIDVVKAPVGAPEGRLQIAYNGYGNDRIQPGVARQYAWYAKQGIEWPTHDPRVFYGLVDKPRIFIVGAAARGITQTAKKITPASRITATEINPGILSIMQRDFVEESGRAYAGLDPIRGNALAVLRGARKFDILTLINTHAGRTIGYPAGPDTLHTAESYHLYFDHLGPNGVVLMEERPFNRGGQLGVLRMLRTYWQVLEERGVDDPADHFMVWDWMSSSSSLIPAQVRVQADGTLTDAEQYYQGIIVSREPLTGERADKALAWFSKLPKKVRLVYLHDTQEVGEIAQLFDALGTGDLSRWTAEGFDDRPLTRDRPFASLSRVDVPVVDDLLRRSAALCGALGVVLLLTLKRGKPLGLIAPFVGYNILIGAGYFFVEILLMQVYQDVFVSASASLVWVLGLLLVASGAGGALLGRLHPAAATALLVPLALGALWLPDAMLAAGVWPGVQQLIAVGVIGAVGMLMGVYFPHGLAAAHRRGLGDRVPLLFALNAVAGSFAVVLTLWIGVHHGYRLAMGLALVAYAAASLIRPGGRPA